MVSIHAYCSRFGGCSVRLNVHAHERCSQRSPRRRIARLGRGQLDSALASNSLAVPALSKADVDRAVEELLREGRLDIFRNRGRARSTMGVGELRAVRGRAARFATGIASLADGGAALLRHPEFIELLLLALVFSNRLLDAYPDELVVLSRRDADDLDSAPGGLLPSGLLPSEQVRRDDRGLAEIGRKSPTARAGRSAASRSRWIDSTRTSSTSTGRIAVCACSERAPQRNAKLSWRGSIASAVTSVSSSIVGGSRTRRRWMSSSMVTESAFGRAARSSRWPHRAFMKRGSSSRRR